MTSMIGSFERQHLATLCKYAGISFISGAVNHGMFSGERSLITAVTGIVVYVFGAFLFRRDDETATDWRNLLGYGVVASIGLGFFTGGLQHFPDSPDRSLWVVPLGFVTSLAAFYALEGRDVVPKATIIRFGLVASAVVLVASIGAWWVFHHFDFGHGAGHHH